MSTLTKSQEAFFQAKALIPGGVNSPVRSFQGVGGTPPFIDSGQGATLTDIDGNTYLDFCQSWGALILGHAHPDLVSAVQKAVAKGTSFGVPTLLETKLAQLVVNAVPSIEQVRFVNSGTEATMSAVRLARAFTNRQIIIKFDGCYHGHADSLLGASPDELISIPYNNIEALEKTFIEHHRKIAAVIVEPVAGNMGVVLSQVGFLEELRRQTHKYEALLIFDEVITGFRLGLGGAQAHYNVIPDLTCLGKIIGGGFPVGAYGGRKDIMQLIAPVGPVYQAGTLSGNPIAMTAGITTLEILAQANFYKALNQKSEQFINQLRVQLQKIETEHNSIQINAIASIFTIFFADKPINNLVDAQSSNQQAFARLHQKMLAQGVYLSPSPLEANFISTAHTEKDLEQIASSC